MTVVNFTVSHTLGDAAERLKARVAAKTGDTTARVQSAWIEAAQQVTRSGEYARSIQAEWPASSDPFCGRVFSSASYAAALEYGAGARDLKTALLASPKAHVNATGGRYISIPMRHGTPGAESMPAMPQDIYQAAKVLGRYATTRDRLSGTRMVGGASVSDRAWRTKLPVGGMQSSYTWKTGPYAEMVKAGMPGHTQYMTWRTVSTNSDPSSWWYPGFAGRHVRQRALATLVLPPGLSVG